MCLLLIAYKKHPEYKLIVAANRDEFYDRPTAPVKWWDDNPSVLGGKDLKSGGTWLGMTKSGKFAAITNYRDPESRKDNARSRGLVVSDYLSGDCSASDYVDSLSSRSSFYNGFNLMCGDAKGLYYYSNRGGDPLCLGAGLYGLSNHLLDSPWPKVEKGKKVLSKILFNAPSIFVESVFSLLENNDIPPDPSLPDTGVGIDWERILSPIFIKSEKYGTRSSTVILVDNRGEVYLKERSFVPPSENSYSFKIYS